MIHLRQMNENDCDAVAALLQRNAQSNGGGLFGEYPKAKVLHMLQSSLNVVVALQDDRLAGVAFSFRPDTDHLPAIARYIFSDSPDLADGRWLYGPVCISGDERGRGILRMLCDELCGLNTGSPLAFINVENIASIKAHSKIGFEVIQRTVMDDMEWCIVEKRQ